MAATKVRALRVPDTVWESAQDTADAQGETVSAFVRRALAAYVADPNATDAALAEIRGRTTA